MSATLIQQTIVPDDCFCTNTHKDNNLCYTYGEEGETSCRIYQKNDQKNIIKKSVRKPHEEKVHFET